MIQMIWLKNKDIKYFKDQKWKKNILEVKAKFENFIPTTFFEVHESKPNFIHELMEIIFHDGWNESM